MNSVLDQVPRSVGAAPSPTTLSGNRPFGCTYDNCGKAFARRSDLIRHMRIHSNERPWKCHFPNCTRCFIQRSALTVHIRVHTGERPHKCMFDGCDKTFSDSSSLARHRRIHTGNRPYRCMHSGCDEAYARKAALVLHQRECGHLISKARKPRASTETPQPQHTQHVLDVPLLSHEPLPMASGQPYGHVFAQGSAQAQAPANAKAQVQSQVSQANYPASTQSTQSHAQTLSQSLSHVQASQIAHGNSSSQPLPPAPSSQPPQHSQSLPLYAYAHDGEMVYDNYLHAPRYYTPHARLSSAGSLGSSPSPTLNTPLSSVFLSPVLAQGHSPHQIYFKGPSMTRSLSDCPVYSPFYPPRAVRSLSEGHLDSDGSPAPSQASDRHQRTHARLDSNPTNALNHATLGLGLSLPADDPYASPFLYDELVKREDEKPMLPPQGMDLNSIAMATSVSSVSSASSASHSSFSSHDDICT